MQREMDNCPTPTAPEAPLVAIMLLEAQLFSLAGGKLQEGKEWKRRLEMKFHSGFGIAMGAGPRSLDIVSLEFGSHQ